MAANSKMNARKVTQVVEYLPCLGLISHTTEKLKKTKQIP